MGMNERTVQRDQLVTIGDLLEFKENLLIEIRKLLKESNVQGGRRWVKALEIRKIFGLGDTKLQRLRDKGVIPFKKLGRVTYYNMEEINDMMASGQLKAYL